MSIATMLTLLGVIQTVMQDTPRAIAVFNSIKTMIASGAEPTAAQWAALNAQLTADHAAVQSA